MSLIESAVNSKRGTKKRYHKRRYGAILLVTKIFQVPAFPLKNFDPTGAGDSFIGGFVGSLSEKQLSFQAMKTAVAGSAIASYTVQQFGTKELEN